MALQIEQGRLNWVLVQQPRKNIACNLSIDHFAQSAVHSCSSNIDCFPSAFSRIVIILKFSSSLNLTNTFLSVVKNNKKYD